jgi:hypothetical protein
MQNNYEYEKFTADDTTFATDFAKDFKNNPVSYAGYLKLLTKYKNTSHKLILEDSYNKILNNKNLQASDILNLL